MGSLSASEHVICGFESQHDTLFGVEKAQRFLNPLGKSELMPVLMPDVLVLLFILIVGETTV